MNIEQGDPHHQLELDKEKKCKNNHLVCSLAKKLSPCLLIGQPGSGGKQGADDGSVSLASRAVQNCQTVFVLQLVLGKEFRRFL